MSMIRRSSTYQLSRTAAPPVSESALVARVSIFSSSNVKLLSNNGFSTVRSYSITRESFRFVLSSFPVTLRKASCPRKTLDEASRVWLPLEFSMIGNSSKRYFSEIGLKEKVGSRSSIQPEVVLNRMKELSNRPGALDDWITHHLSDQQRSELMQLVAKAPSVLPSGALPANTSNGSTAHAIPEPSRRDLKLVALTTAIPFVGFGIMDNSILIIAGDVIDTTLGVTLGISTMCAAAIGNIISDVAGIGLGTVIEDFCALYLKLPVPNISTAQRQLRSVRFANQFGCCVGIVIGCIIGMFPLLYIDSNKVHSKKREAHLDSIFKDVITQAGALVGAARICLYLRVDDKTNPLPTHNGKYIYIKYDAASAHRYKTIKATKPSDVFGDVTKHECFVPIGKGIISRSLLTGESCNIADVQLEPDFDPLIGYVDWEDAVYNAGRKSKAMICVPILDSAGRPIAVIQAVNKVRKGREDLTSSDSKTSKVVQQGMFTESDVRILKALASHISVSLQSMYEEAEGKQAEVRLRDTIRILKEYGLAGITHEESNTRTSPEIAQTSRTLSNQH